MTQATLPTAYGTLYLTADKKYLTGISTQPSASKDHTEDAGLLRDTVSELSAYLAGDLHAFTVPWRLPASETTFTRKAQAALLDIPYGTTVTYKELAAALGNPTAARAVGQACATNLLLILLPCHRVLPSTGTIGNYAGGQAMKRALLNIEQGKPV